VHVLDLIPGTFALVRLPATAPLPSWTWTRPFASVTRTECELSIVCAESAVPSGQPRDGDWRCLAVRGPLDLTLTGVLASIAAPLAAADVSIFTIATYDTDYVLVKSAALSRARAALARAGHRVVTASDDA
jgi:uncharacterized protein